jgi:hypothetical protein
MPKRVSIYTFDGLSNHELSEIAVKATVDRRCVVKYLKGLAITNNSRVRIEKALRLLHRETLIRMHAPPPTNGVHASAHPSSPPPPSSRGAN